MVGQICGFVAGKASVSALVGGVTCSDYDYDDYQCICSPKKIYFAITYDDRPRNFMPEFISARSADACHEPGEGHRMDYQGSGISLLPEYWSRHKVL